MIRNPPLGHDGPGPEPDPPQNRSRTPINRPFSRGKPGSAAGEGSHAPGQPDEENMKNGQKAVAITTIESDPDTQCAVEAPQNGHAAGFTGRCGALG